jgi:hypothetical protein
MNSEYAHYLIEVYYNGEKRTYGGAGNGGGQGIDKNQVKYFYRFDGSNSDAYKDLTLQKLAERNNYYGSLEVPDDMPEDGKLSWQSIRDKTGEGAYVKVMLLTSVWSFAETGEGFAYLYDNGCTYENNPIWGGIGYISNGWYDGRYYNRYEFCPEGS